MKVILFKRRWRKAWVALAGAAALLLPLEAAMQTRQPEPAPDDPAQVPSLQRDAASAPRVAASQAGGPPDSARDKSTQVPELRPRMRPELAPNPPTEEELRPRMQPDQAGDAPVPLPAIR